MNERLSRIINSPKRVPIVAGVVAFGVGFGVGYFLARRNASVVVEPSNQLAFDFDAYKLPETGNGAVEPIRKNTVVHPAQEVKDIPVYERQGQKLVKVVEGENFVASKIKEAMTTSKEVMEEVVTHSIFANNDDDWNYAKEVRGRSESSPYIIHKDEFYSDEKGYSQKTLTYYSGDNIMVDEEDAPMYNHEDITGPLLFGHGSGDPNVVHIRNDKRKSEYEVLYDPGLYSIEVLGLEIENNQRVQDIQHSKNRKFILE